MEELTKEERMRLGSELTNKVADLLNEFTIAHRDSIAVSNLIKTQLSVILSLSIQVMRNAKDIDEKHEEAMSTDLQLAMISIMNSYAIK